MALIASGQSLSSLADGIPQYPIIRGSVAGNGRDVDVDVLTKTIRPKQVSSVDGVKLALDDGWVLVRPSGTEPKVRITAEAKTAARARQLFDLTVKAIGESSHSGGQAA